MRARASIVLHLKNAKEPTDSRDKFWGAYARLARDVEFPDSERRPDRIAEYARVQETRLRRRFPHDLREALNEVIPSTVVIVRSLEYQSLRIDLDLITGSLAAVGLTPDDLWALLAQYTPLALDASLDANVYEALNI